MNVIVRTPCSHLGTVGEQYFSECFCSFRRKLSCKLTVHHCCRASDVPQLCAALYLGVGTVRQAQVSDDGVHPVVLICGGVLPTVEAQIGTEQKVLSHRQSAHQDIVLGAHGWWRHKALGGIRNVTASKDVCVCVCVPGRHTQSWVWGPLRRLSHPPWLFLASVQRGPFSLQLHPVVWEKEKETDINLVRGCRRVWHRASLFACSRTGFLTMFYHSRWRPWWRSSRASWCHCNK